MIFFSRLRAARYGEASARLGFFTAAAAPLPRVEPILRPRADISETRELAEVLGLQGFGLPSASGALVTPASGEALAVVAACVRVISNAAAMLPLRVMRRLGDNRREPATDHPLYRVLKTAPREGQTAFELRKLWLRDLLLRGNAYGLPTWGARGQVIELRRLHPDRVQVERNEQTGTARYRYLRPGGQQIELPASRILHMRNLADDDLVGVSPITAYRETVGDGLSLREHGSNFIRNGARLSGVLQSKGQIKGPEAKAAMRADFKRLYAGAKEAGEVAVLDQGIEFQPISVTLADAQWLDARKFNRGEIAGIYGVPPHLIADLERSTNNNIEHQAIEFVQHCLQPWLVLIEQSLETALLESPDLYVTHDIDAILRGDFKSRTEGFAILRRIGAVSPNEIREMLDWAPREDEGADSYIIEANMRLDDGTNPPSPSGLRRDEGPPAEPATTEGNA